MDAVFGTQSWSYTDWVGSVYDAGTRADRYLAEYAREFATVENDSTFYGTPLPERVARWVAQVPAGFTFACKMWSEITHERRLHDATRLIAEFYDAMRCFGTKLSAVLVQFEASYGRAEEPDFRAALRAFPRDVPTAFEFRDAAWYEPDVQALLESHGFALALTDGPYVPRERMAAALARTQLDFAYLRWLGPHDRFTRFDRVQLSHADDIVWWAEAVRRAPSLRRLYGYANNEYEGHAPATVRSLYAAFGIPHERPERIVQPDLFNDSLSS